MQMQADASALASPASQGATGTASKSASGTSAVNGGRFDFDDGGTYCGGWEDGKAHGHGVCTGPKGQGAYSGSWHFGFEVSGVYTWPSGSTYEGQWQNGKRHALGVETRGRWVYRGEWTQGAKGRYGVRQSANSLAKYEGTWASGLQDGYGSETYADGGTYQGQWLRGMRHGYGVRASAPFGQASHYRPHKGQLRASMSSLRSNEPGGGAAGSAGAGGTLDPAAERDRRVDDSRGGFVLKARSDEPPARRRSLVEKSGLKKSLLSGLKLRKQRSTGDIEKRGTSGGSLRSNASSASWVSTESEQSAFTSASQHTDSNASFVIEDEHMDASVTETYMGEWKNDKRSGFGISERSDGLRYEGEWFNNKKYGYGVTTLRDGTREEGKYKNNVLITSQKKKHLFLIRSAKFRERIDAAVSAAQRASKIALQKADIAISRTATARGKAELADIAATHAREDHEIARLTAKQFAPDFQQPGLDRIGKDAAKFRPPAEDAQPGKSILTKTGSIDQINHQGPKQQLQPQQPQHQQQQNQHQQQFQPPQHNYQPPQQQGYQQGYQPQGHQPQGHQPQGHQPQGYQPQGYQPQGYQQQLQPQYQHTITPPTPLPPESNSMPSYPSLSAPQQQGPMGAVSQGLGMGMSMGVGMGLAQQPPPASQQVPDPDQMSMRRSSLRRNSRLVTSNTIDSPGYNFQQAMSDHFDQYKRPPSRDSSVDRYSRAAGRLSMGSRQPSVDKSTPTSELIDRARAERAGSNTRGTTPAPQLNSQLSAQLSAVAAAAGAGASMAGLGMGMSAGNGSAVGAGAAPAPYTVPTREPPFEDVLLRKRNLGQDIIPSPGQPKRTESLYVNPAARGAPKSVPVVSPLQRKKSLPDVAGMPGANEAMSREEVSVLSSARREEIRRLQEENERLRANPLLYLVSPHVKDWFSRQQLVMLVLFVNISLAIMFFKLLT